jgi:hypothetical protein
VLAPADGLCCVLNKNRIMDNVKKSNNSRKNTFIKINKKCYFYNT